MDIHSGEAIQISFIVATIINWDQLLKKRICFSKNKLLIQEYTSFMKCFLFQESEYEVTESDVFSG